MSAAIERRYGDEKTVARLFDSGSACGAVPAASRSPFSRQRAATRTAQIRSPAAIARSRLSVPSPGVFASTLVNIPEKIQPLIAPAPTRPKTRLASRVVRR